MLRIEILNC